MVAFTLLPREREERERSMFLLVYNECIGVDGKTFLLSKLFLFVPIGCIHHHLEVNYRH